MTPNWMWNPGNDPEVDDDLMAEWLKAVLLSKLPPERLQATVAKLVTHMSAGKTCVTRVIDAVDAE